MDKKYAFFLSLLITLALAVSLFSLPSRSSEARREQAVIARVIDGDTLELSDGRTIRLLNINTPEKGFFGAEQAKSFLKSFENSSVEIEITGTDKYYRNLARIYSTDYLNLKIVQLGLASKFLVQDEEKGIFAEAEEKAIKESAGIWNHSSYFGCFESELNPKEEFVKLKSKCGAIDISNWKLKDESRKTYTFGITLEGEITLHSLKGEDNLTDIFWQSSSDIWNNDADSLYLFDENGGIAHYEFYGY